MVEAPLSNLLELVPPATSILAEVTLLLLASTAVLDLLTTTCLSTSSTSTCLLDSAEAKTRALDLKVQLRISQRYQYVAFHNLILVPERV